MKRISGTGIFVIFITITFSIWLNSWHVPLAQDFVFTASSFQSPEIGQNAAFSHLITQSETTGDSLLRFQSRLSVTSIDPGNATYSVRIEAAVSEATGTFQAIPENFRFDVLVDSNTQNAIAVTSTPLQVCPATLDFLGFSIFQEQPEISSGETWSSNDTLLQADATMINGSPALNLIMESNLASGDYLLTTEWPFMVRADVRMDEVVITGTSQNLTNVGESIPEGLPAPPVLGNTGGVFSITRNILIQRL